jgi:hypothetical protein
LGIVAFVRGDVSILSAVRVLIPPELALALVVLLLSLLREAGSHLAITTAAMPRTCLISARASTLWQWVHSSWHYRLETALALLSFRPSRCSKVMLYNCRH